MRYLMLINTVEAEDAKATPEEGAASFAEYAQLMEELGAQGIVLGGERLRPTSTATTIRVLDGQVLTTDGPFAETKEQIGGYFLVDCKDIDEAIEVAARIPAARAGSVEVRPIWEE
jgi:hypothetical protein